MLKHWLFKSIALIPVFLIFTLSKLGAQTPEFPDVSTLSAEQLFDALITPMYALIVLASGYFSYLIPGLKKIAPFYRVFAFAFIAGLGFYLYGVSFWKIASTYFFSSGLYVLFLKNIFASPKLSQG